MEAISDDLYNEIPPEQLINEYQRAILDQKDFREELRKLKDS